MCDCNGKCGNSCKCIQVTISYDKKPMVICNTLEEAKDIIEGCKRDLNIDLFSVSVTSKHGHIDDHSNL